MEASLGGPFAFSLQAARSMRLLSNIASEAGRAQELKTAWALAAGGST